MNFEDEVSIRIQNNETNTSLLDAAKQFMWLSIASQYSYNFSWLGRPIIQYPQDIVAMQELIWRIKPDLIIETGVAHGGSIIMSASLLALIDYSEAAKEGKCLDPGVGSRRVLGLDIEIRPHNRVAIENHPLAHRIDMIEGNSIDPGIVERVYEYAQRYNNVLVCLDSSHTHDHVLAELEAYAPLTTLGSYCVAFDTVIEDLPDNMFPDRSWGKGDNPKTAVREYLRRVGKGDYKGVDGMPLKFEVDRMIENKLLITVGRGGYLRRIA